MDTLAIDIGVHVQGSDPELRALLRPLVVVNPQLYLSILRRLFFLIFA